MARPSGRQERLEAVMGLIAASGSVRLRDAATRLGVTEMTLRRDVAGPHAPLRALGGWLVRASLAPDYDLPAEMDRHVEAKRAAARAALPLIRPGTRIFVDCGTTTVHLAPLLAGPLTVVTHALPVAQIVAQAAGQGGDLALDLLGGAYHPATAAFFARPALPDGSRFDLAVISAGGIDSDGALSCSHGAEVALKQAVIAASRQRIVLADRSKLDLRRPYVFASRAVFDAVVLDPA
ncbi:DeoR family transcriptional regulator [Paracoccus sp. S-4012]|uniref:DeoR/GlpR family DNA-binding transcription regulator n=1 Tax=Paracoccus sp. S-4012 TaxID=2665648 RepID=UPI0012AFA22F|nr:DeoR/GlpR family DNA-binding transcription regulator [Paracoccus sp. S-4012]MRX51911.1 DeoR family transcriptional regulator [Paracoccus sp. S-4012]